MMIRGKSLRLRINDVIMSVDYRAWIIERNNFIAYKILLAWALIPNFCVEKL